MNWLRLKGWREKGAILVALLLISAVVMFFHVFVVGVENVNFWSNLK
ncbi:hypothetical protein [Henriciella sp.]|nr:hypothetical protein [Henriciella sp.]